MKGPKESEHISHGICDECFEKYYPEVVEEQEQLEPQPASLNFS